MSVHEYHARTSWSGSTAAGYRDYSRAHDGSAAPADAALTLSADPHFRGDPALLNPEQLVVLAASSCQLLSFLALAARRHVDVLSYQDDARGTMDDARRSSRIDHIELRPNVRVAAGTDAAFVEQLVHQAHEECYIANSLNTDMTINATIVVDDEAGATVEI